MYSSPKPKKVVPLNKQYRCSGVIWKVDMNNKDRLLYITTSFLDSFG